MTVVGTRPEIIRLSRVLTHLDMYCDHVLVHTGQNYDYELNQIFFDELSIRKPDYFLNSAIDSTGPAHTIGNLIISVDRIMEIVQPDSILILGDTNSGLAVIPAKRRMIPIFHMEAGNRCFDQRVPEEINRKIIDHVADVNLTYSSIARDYLLREGLPPDLVIKTGSPMYEVLMHYWPQIDASDVLERLELMEKNFFVVSAHREENIESSRTFNRLSQVINFLAEDYGLPVIVSTHPRTQNRINEMGVNFHSLVRLLRPFGFFDYIKLQVSAKTVLSDSGTINEEASILNFPALNLREAHERPEGMEETAVMMVGLDRDRIRQAIEIIVNQPRNKNRIGTHTIRQVADYSVPNVSEKVVRIIHSYTDYVNRVVWKKY